MSIWPQRAAAVLANDNIIVDWSIRDEGLYNDIFSGKPVNSCNFCHFTSHVSNFCPLQLESNISCNQEPFRRPLKQADRQQPIDIHGRARLFHLGKEVCNNFNSEPGCSATSCIWAPCCASLVKVIIPSMFALWTRQEFITRRKEGHLSKLAGIHPHWHWLSRAQAVKKRELTPSNTLRSTTL